VDIQELAAHARTFFEQKTFPATEGRPERRIWIMKDRHPIWVKDMVYKAHEDIAADDYKYAYVVDTLDALDEGQDPEEGKYELEADVYNWDLIQWLGSNLERIGFVDEAVKELGHSSNLGIMGDLMVGQVQEKSQVWASVVESLQERLDEIEDDVQERFESGGEVERGGARGWKL